MPEASSDALLILLPVAKRWIELLIPLVELFSEFSALWAAVFVFIEKDIPHLLFLLY
jgi:hypothetical protein